MRDTLTPLEAGLGHLAAMLAKNPPAPIDRGQSGLIPRRIWFVPGAVEYVFWEEPKPEILCWFGEPILVASSHAGLSSHATVEGTSNLRDHKAEWSQRLTQGLRDVQAALADASTRCDSSQFELLLGGAAGTFFVYDWWRTAAAAFRGRRMQLDHSDKLR